MEVKVLFICLGNICRSPMAEAVFRNLVERDRLSATISCDSAGTGGWHTGNPPHQGTRDILKLNKISDTGIFARQLLDKDLEQFDYLIAMDNSNISNIKKLSEALDGTKVRLLMDYTEHYSGKEVPDPYYTGNFEEVYELVKDGCEGLLQEIKSKYLL
ncbi:low molecular weight protein-tyrosine-phosphatase [Bacillus sp. B1-b2]|uniref:low molecular weight protein-tyrosine-phosphatase n=1 Tax=Bacillus sp. B1-b2 TaxID=2653201 RepID=UPI001261BFE1|nr:low molecular weight protein-tyrosine-phosphatase [Bacillus sp. B1-b2]KAB7672529.1 low molecular weight phosphotyrosine protein phosphatase [Bacillus sp. B1-b2]